MYEKIVDENPYKTPMMIYPAVHYTMGGLWVDYNLMTTIPGCYAIGEANFSDHGANRLGASALMQGLADGYFIAPNCVGNYLATQSPIEYNINHSTVKEDISNAKLLFDKLINTNGKYSVDEIHKKLGRLMWDYVGMARNEKGLKFVYDEIEKLKDLFYNDINIPGNQTFNPELEKAGRLGDFLELGQLMALDALD